ncbi:hypothetical protein SLEP1_g40061 [Rubroshorea leprosula]|uniref:BRWD/PHIP N-terminal domain-containing protein n=1 Tax=Rubroshorea leprosula TaxID=152421 RepID=A0AAV5L2V7_9ROSI|nr:hypothetical protein SLEP1_g40061 [Rubroshorea leprosula]
MALRKYVPSTDSPSVKMKPLSFTIKVRENAQLADPGTSQSVEAAVDVDPREVYFLIMHFLSNGPCQRTFEQLQNEILEHQLLPRRYHSWYSRKGAHSGDENDDGMSFPLNHDQLVERNPHIEKDHIVKLLRQLILSTVSPSQDINGRHFPNAADVPTLLGRGSFSLLSCSEVKIVWLVCSGSLPSSDDSYKGAKEVKHPPAHMHWPHVHADQPSTMVQKMQNIKRLRGHRNVVYCAIFDRSGRYVITGSDDRLVKIWSMETAYCLASCRGHEGDITDLAVSYNNVLVASSSNDCIIHVMGCQFRFYVDTLEQLLLLHLVPGLALYTSFYPHLMMEHVGYGMLGISKFLHRYMFHGPQILQLEGTVVHPQVTINGTIKFFAVHLMLVELSLSLVWNACRSNSDDPEKPNHEIDVLSGHENDVNYVQFSGCATASRFSMIDISKEENVPKFRNSWFAFDNIVTCSHDGSAIIWIPRSHKSHGKVGRWMRAYHLKVPPPPMPPQPPRGGPHQRILPTPRGVNMIIWSLDNRFVLAAIMDCRICVWNAADGSLVHSLAGHTESTYVLDGHPFNPRIAMSAGYDGRTIVWDIWEGKPIWIYEISHFKLVDGKFSSDGTSIILSDDVGQLYVLNTGQGEAQQDAKYEQFFLGDYHPLIQDTYGNVVDQETQLAPYRRNMQDLLCDSGMIPYEEPYQTMYQKRRLGALGIEWHPSPLKLTVGPDITLDQEFQMLPLADWDGMVDPLPGFIDVMDWEPEIEVQSDNNDSEYSVTEEFSAGGDKGSLSSSSGESGAVLKTVRWRITMMMSVVHQKGKKERLKLRS